MNISALTKRELEIIRLVRQGLTAHEIGNKLHISYRTVMTHKSKILLKLFPDRKKAPGVDLAKYL